MTQKRVMVFGVFDGIHDGHRYFLKEAKKLGNRLIVVIARDEAAQNLKGKTPRLNLEARIQMVQDENIADEIIAGDENTGQWKVIKKYQPNVIVLGYDQELLGESLKNFDQNLQIIQISPFAPEKYHSSLL